MITNTYVKEYMDALAEELKENYNCMTISEYDDKLNLLYTLERKYPVLKTKNSPTLKAKYRRRHIQRMKREIKILKSLLADNSSGKELTIDLTYEGVLINAVAWGEGFIWERVLYAIRQLGLPLIVPFTGTVKVRCKFSETNDGTGRSFKFHSFELVNITEGVVYQIYQLPVEHDLCFRSFDEFVSLNKYPKAEDYYFAYQGIKHTNINKNNEKTLLLDRIYIDLNVKHPADYKARSLSVSDVVVLFSISDKALSTEAFFVDSIGFKRIPFKNNEFDYNDVERKLLIGLGLIKEQ